MKLEIKKLKNGIDHFNFWLDSNLKIYFIQVFLSSLYNILLIIISVINIINNQLLTQMF